MKKRAVLLVIVLLSVILVVGTGFAYATGNIQSVTAGQVHEGDLITGGNSIANDGAVKGDLLAGAQALSSKGDVEGDIIAVAYDISISGKVGGSVRLAGNNIILSSKVGRNAMVIGSSIIVAKETVIMRNAYLLGNTINSDGTVTGDTQVYGSDVTLGGTYEGDVTINDMVEGTVLKMLPGTVIRGRLTYKGITEYKVPNDVKAGSYEFIKIEPARATEETGFDLWKLVRKVFTLIVYYLFALLLYKLFPRFFAGSGDFIGTKPLTAVGIGIATLGSLVGGSLLLILLLILAIVIFNGSVFFFAGLVFTFIMAITVLFADIPVSLWLGGLISGRSISVPAKLAAGLAVISVIKLGLYFLGSISVLSTVAGILSFLVNAAIWTLGTGSLLKTIFEIFKCANARSRDQEELTEDF